MKNKAIEKIKAQLAEANPKEDRYVKAVKTAVADALISFSGQKEEFAAAIVQSEKHLHECFKYVVRDVKSAISDLDVYRRAVDFYFPGAVVDMTLTIRMSEYEKKAESQTSEIPASRELTSSPKGRSSAAESAPSGGEMKFDLLDLLEV